MSVPVAYVTVILIWSTTPLGISWSSQSLSPIASISLRMSLAAMVGVALVKLLGVRIRWDLPAVKVYACSLMGIYGAMFCTYLAVPYVTTGLVSVLFALSPVISGVLSALLLNNTVITRTHMLAYAISFSGLMIVSMGANLAMSGALTGVVLMLVAVFLYSLSGVLVQRANYEGHPFALTVGSLVSSVPLFFFTWLIFDGSLPAIELGDRGVWALLYLALFGSLVGFVAYYYILQALGASAVATVTLITPVLALCLGRLLNNEIVSETMLLGTGAILLGLSLYFSEQSRLVKASKANSIA